MNFGRSRGGRGDEEEADMMPPNQSQSKSAVPPACPRCEVTKSQFNRTIQNYQKAFRKKVEGLKVELKSSRSDTRKLQKKVNQLSSWTRVHIPSLLAGAVFGVSGYLVAAAFRRRYACREASVINTEPSQPEQTQPAADEEDEDTELVIA